MFDDGSDACRNPFGKIMFGHLRHARWATMFGFGAGIVQPNVRGDRLTSYAPAPLDDFGITYVHPTAHLVFRSFTPVALLRLTLAQCHGCFDEMGGSRIRC